MFNIKESIKMKNLTIARKKLTFAMIIAAAFFFTLPCNTTAQEKKFYKAPANMQATMINNLKNGINSDNDGLRRCSIYLAGYYQINELTGILSELLKKSEDSKDKVIILMALYKIGGETSYNAINSFLSGSTDVEANEVADMILQGRTAGNPSSLSLGR